MAEHWDKVFSNPEIVTLAVYILGGETKNVDTEDIAMKSYELAPVRFAWAKYKDQVNLVNVRISLSDAKKPKKYGYLCGSLKEGWSLSKKGLTYAKQKFKYLKDIDISQVTLRKQEIIWQRNEKNRMLATPAHNKTIANQVSALTIREAEEFFRLDDYITGKARQAKISKIVNIFKNDPDLSNTIKTLIKMVHKQ